MGYLKAVLNDDKNLEIKNLKILISTGKQLKRDVSKYEKELKKYDGQAVSKERPKIIKLNEIENVKKIDNIKKPKVDDNADSSKYTIKAVVSRDNMIIIDFYDSITKDFVDFKEDKTSNTFQDIYQLKGNFKDAYPTKLSIDGVDQIVIKQKDSKTLEILFEDKTNLKTIYFINRNRVVLKVLDLNKKKNKATISKAVKVYKPGLNRVVVLDAGHGGKDSGAIGSEDKMYEKYTVFNVTKYLESVLKERGYKVYLTRNNDRFIKVRNRTVLANDKHADIFVSIHANAAHKSKIKELQGIETFFLSPARSERAKRVAALENQSDISNMSGSTQKAFLESLNRPRITASHKLSIDIQRNMLYETRLLHKDVEDGGVREGPFWVLVGAQMPSVLIEIGYITHPKEGKRLFNKKYQEALAVGIANGIDSYFAKNP
ncbi:N-acetylmuramoyl-L-alanine amidase [Halarcobacter ebronensis]|uniref:N-acetylmuramoyl-L-alanine amidase n=1 Tax=Halarcobacter ebronensis TaxID=1462615 RepID=A0A4V1LRC8_9BACT|nr:N-acetylmuramoyl-L-alanine amidase [Halarcobacter ebronensis]RXJ67748.1 N-acetylmuramoyl-L-alanine amidase [Halarcobacter ebronensis]